MQNHFTSTETFRAAHNLTIQHDGAAWRLVNGAQASGDLIALFEARLDRITCLPAFARARKLPGNGQLRAADIARVVVGWAPESRNWHLGVMLAAKPERDFKQQWCGLASWPSGPANESYDQARLAGLALARVIKRPFHLVPAPDPVPPGIGKTQQIPTTQQIQVEQAMAAQAQGNTQGYVQPAPPPVAPPAPPPVAPPVARPLIDRVPDVQTKSPPFKFEEWTMQQTRWGFVWVRRGRWLFGGVLRAAGFFVLAVLFVLLGIGTQTRGLANVEPFWLPWLGLAVAVLLAGMALRSLWVLVTVTDVLVDVTRREVCRQGRFFGRQQWRMGFDEIDHVLVSQTPIRPEGRDKKLQPMSTSQDVWLHVYNGAQFWPVVKLGRVEGQCLDWEQARQSYKTKGRRRLTLAFYDTPAHHAARVMADAMQVDVWLDIR